MDQMLTAGYRGGWGLGRHVLSSDYFYYVRDPWGSYCEYSFDIDYVPEGFVWRAHDQPARAAGQHPAGRLTAGGLYKGHGL
jgi:hypothetical protein